VQWLAVSLVLSVVLTVVFNVALRVFPGLGTRIRRGVEALATPAADDRQPDDRRVRVFFPWKVMLAASVALTILVNALRWMR
jgi:hypothetical protein